MSTTVVADSPLLRGNIGVIDGCTACWFASLLYICCVIDQAVFESVQLCWSMTTRTIGWALRFCMSKRLRLWAVASMFNAQGQPVCVCTRQVKYNASIMMSLSQSTASRGEGAWNLQALLASTGIYTYTSTVLAADVHAVTRNQNWKAKIADIMQHSLRSLLQIIVSSIAVIVHMNAQQSHLGHPAIL